MKTKTIARLFFPVLTFSLAASAACADVFNKTYRIDLVASRSDRASPCRIQKNIYVTKNSVFLSEPFNLCEAQETDKANAHVQGDVYQTNSTVSRHVQCEISKTGTVCDNGLRFSSGSDTPSVSHIDVTYSARVTENGVRLERRDDGANSNGGSTKAYLYHELATDGASCRLTENGFLVSSKLLLGLTAERSNALVSSTCSALPGLHL